MNDTPRVQIHKLEVSSVSIQTLGTPSTIARSTLRAQRLYINGCPKKKDQK